MAELFASGRIIDAVLLLVALETAGLIAWRLKVRRGPRPASILCNNASGACLMLALRGALTGAAWPWLAAALLGALVAHVADLRLRMT